MPNPYQTLGNAPITDDTDYLTEEIQFDIDSNMRTIAVPTEGVVIGVQGDKNVNRVNFRMPAWYNGFDMTTFQPRINFVDPEGNVNYYTVTDMKIYDPEGNEVTDTPTTEDIIYFTWLVDSYATNYIGTVVFNVRFSKFNSTTHALAQAFNTTKAACQVLEGITLADEITQEQQEDLLFHMTADLQEVTDKLKLDLEAKGAEVLETIPDNYNDVNNQIDGLKTDLNRFKSGDWSNTVDMTDYTLIRGMEITINSISIDSIDCTTSAAWAGVCYTIPVKQNTTYILVFDVNKSANYYIDVTNEAQNITILNCGTPSVGTDKTYYFNSSSNDKIVVRFSSTNANDTIKISNLRIRTFYNESVDYTLSVSGKGADAETVGKVINNSVGNNSVIAFTDTTNADYGYIQHDVSVSGNTGDIYYVGINSITGNASFTNMKVYFYTNEHVQVATLTRIGEVIEVVAPNNYSSIRLFIDTGSRSQEANVIVTCCKKTNDNFISANNMRIDDSLSFVAKSINKIQDVNLETTNTTYNGYKFVFPEIIPLGAVCRVSIPITNPFGYKLLVISDDKILLDVIDMPTNSLSNYSIAYISTIEYNDSIYIGVDVPAGSPLHFRNYDSYSDAVSSGYKMHKATQIQNSSNTIGEKQNFNVNDIYQSYQVGIEYVNFANSKPKSNCITVGKSGCNFATINDAINSISDDSVENPYTIMIYPGIYDEVVDIRGQRHISLIGVNRDKCIIRDTSGRYYNSPVRIAGDFVMENLTVIANADNADPDWSPTGWNPSTNYLDYPSYAVHIDDADNTDGMVYGRIRNCTLYSECFHAIGCGMHPNQTLEIENCKIIRNTSREDFLDDDYHGAMGIHSTLDENDTNQFVTIKNCEISYNHDNAVQLYHYYATSPMKVTFIGCTASDGNGTSNLVYYKGEDSTKSNYIGVLSHGNNTSEMNN